MTKARAGLINGLLGVATFSASLPATRLAVSALDPLFVTCARAAIAGAIGGVLLALLRERRPAPADLGMLAVVALGVVLGFPLLSALALTHMPANHAIVFTGLLPIATTLAGLRHGGERPHPAFWIFSAVGAGAIGVFALGSGISPLGDGLMLAAVAVCGVGYAEGARLARRLGGWQVISWALVLSLPVMAPLALVLQPASWQAVGWPAIAGLGYVSLFSMLIGFVFWYRGLALGGIAAVAPLQQLQPFLALAVAALVVGEQIAPTTVVVAASVVLCVAGARRYSRRAAPAAGAQRA